MKANGLSFELIRAEDIKKGCLKNYAMLFVPGGWASNKLKPLGDKGIKEIKKFVHNGGNYLGFCGGAGLATLDGIGLLNIKRKPTKERVPSFSGRIYLNVNEHPIWARSKIQNPKFTSKNSELRALNSKLIFHAWWPSQFLIKGNSLEILATYGNALPDSFSSDLNVGDVETNSEWSGLEELYGINLNPERLKNEPAVIEGTFGKGRIILSLIHFDTPDDANGAVVLRNVWSYLGGEKLRVKSQNLKIQDAGFKIRDNHASPSEDFKLTLISELTTAVNELISLGIRNFLWYWKTPMLLHWRRGIRGLEYCTLYAMVKEISYILMGHNFHSNFHDRLLRIRELLIPFAEKAKQLLVLERHALQKGHITYEDCNDYEIQKIRTELFTRSKSYGGLFKNLVNEMDDLLFSLIKQREVYERVNE